MTTTIQVIKDCETCQGTGQIKAPPQPHLTEARLDCDNCGGTGTIDEWDEIKTKQDE